MSNTLVSTNPFTGQLLQEYAVYSGQQIQQQLEATDKAFQEYRKTSWEKRARIFKCASELLVRDKDIHANRMTQEMGKPITQAIAEIEKCASLCRYYADETPHLLHQPRTEIENGYVQLAVEPLGTLLAIMPWNFPFWQVFRAATPALAIGNCVVLKHASNVTGSALAIEAIFKEAGLPEDVFAVLPIPSSDAEAVIANPLIQAVTFTGSTDAGRKVAEAAGRNLKKTVLELGGSDPYLVFSDADIEKAAEICLKARMVNNGQSCVAAKRFIVVAEVYAKFRDAFVEQFKTIKAGDPLDVATTLGPLVNEKAAQGLHEQVNASVAKGAKILVGGDYKNGTMYPATLLENVLPGQPAFEEELFGPVASLIKADTVEDALGIANATPFGLGSAIFSKDHEKAAELARTEIISGSCFVNAQVLSDPRFPFGGVKESGYGRELSGHALHEFANIKTVWVQH